MPELSLPLLLAACAFPLAAAGASFACRRPVVLWRLALAGMLGACVLTALASGAFARGSAAALADPALRALMGSPAFFVDAVSALMLPCAALVWMAALLISPRKNWQPATLRRLLLGETLALATLATDHPVLLAVLLAAGSAVLLRTIHVRLPDARRTTRVFAWPGLAGPLLVLGGVLAMQAASGPGTSLWRVGFGLLLGALWLRAGLVPFHAWVPHLLEHAPLGAAVPLGACHLGAYVFLRLGVPHASTDVLAIVQGAGLVTALLAVGAAVVQQSARRAFGYLSLGQSGIVMAALCSTTEAGRVGGLLFMLSSGLGLAGLGLTLRVLESRRGSQALHVFHGGYERMPHLAWSFLLFGLALSGLPGTLGFASEELLLGSLAGQHVAGALILVIVSAFTGVAVVRMYFALFCGRQSDIHDPQPLRGRERAGVVLLAVTLVVSGILPDRLVAVGRRMAHGAGAAGAEDPAGP